MQSCLAQDARGVSTWLKSHVCRPKTAGVCPDPDSEPRFPSQDGLRGSPPDQSRLLLRDEFDPAADVVGRLSLGQSWMIAGNIGEYESDHLVIARRFKPLRIGSNHHNARRPREPGGASGSASTGS